MKKGLLVLILAAVIAGGAFAVPDFQLSAGIGGFFSGQLSGGAIASYSGALPPGQPSTNEMTVIIPNIYGGGFVFFDATFAELSLGFGGGDGFFTAEGSSTLEYSGVSIFNIELLGKYPFELSEKVTLFPMLGIEYLMVLSREFVETNDIPDDPLNKLFDDDVANGDFSALSIKLGVGCDVSLTDQFYLRISTIFGYRLPNKFEQDVVDKYNKLPNVSTELVPGFNWDMLKVAVGFKF